MGALIPSVAESRCSPAHVEVVPLHVPEAPTPLVAPPAVELDHEPLVVVDVRQPCAAAGLTMTGGQSVSALDIPQIDVRLDTGLDSLGQIDLLYADEKVIIELDGAQAHMTRTRFEEDRRRDAYLAARGYLTLRFTWRRLIAEPAAIASEVRAVLDARRSVLTRIAHRIRV